jgi:hypothetical protein
VYDLILAGSFAFISDEEASPQEELDGQRPRVAEVEILSQRRSEAKWRITEGLGFGARSLVPLRGSRFCWRLRSWVC